MTVLFAIRLPERNDPRAMAVAAVSLRRNGLTYDGTRQIECRHNGGLWQYTIPVIASIRWIA